MKRKILTLFVAVFLMVTLVACGGSSDSIVGKWEAKDLGESFVFEFKDGDEVTLTVSGITAEGTYTTSGDKITLKISMFGQTIMDDEGTYKVNGDTLTITIDGDAQDFTKVK